LKALVVDDHPIMRFGVRQLLQGRWPDAEIGEAATLAEALEYLDKTKPDIIVLDLMLPDASGTEGVSKVLAVSDSVPVLMLSLNSELAFAARLLKMGVAGYLPKDRAAQEIVLAAERVMSGRRYVTASMADHLIGMLGDKSSDAMPHELLSAQEYRVMLLIAEGKSPSEIATIMSLSVKTVGTYRARILEKTNWKNNNELTKYCLQRGLTSG
jgi:two-component system, NarL family, invasion response regulator UvrY